MPTYTASDSHTTEQSTAFLTDGYPYMFGLDRGFRTYSTAPTWRELDDGTELKSTNGLAIGTGSLPADMIFSGAADNYTFSAATTTYNVYGLLIEAPAGVVFDSALITIAPDSRKDGQISFRIKEEIDSDTTTSLDYQDLTSDTRALFVDLNGNQVVTVNATSYIVIRAICSGGSLPLKWGSVFIGKRLQLPRKCLAPGTAAYGWRRELERGGKKFGHFSRRTRNAGGRKLRLRFPLRERSINNMVTVADIESFFINELEFGTLPFVFVGKEKSSTTVEDAIVCRLVEPALNLQKTGKGEYMLDWEVEEVPPFIKKEHY